MDTPVSPRFPKYAEFMERYQLFCEWVTELSAQHSVLVTPTDLSNFCYLLAELQQAPIGGPLLGGITTISSEIKGKEQVFFAFVDYVTQHFPFGWREPLYKLLTLSEHYFQGEGNITTDAVYLHKKGRLYTVEQLANLGAVREGFKPSVVYRDQDGQLWTRPIDEFRHRFCFFLYL